MAGDDVVCLTLADAMRALSALNVEMAELDRKRRELTVGTTIGPHERAALRRWTEQRATAEARNLALRTRITELVETDR